MGTESQTTCLIMSDMSSLKFKRKFCCGEMVTLSPDLLMLIIKNNNNNNNTPSGLSNQKNLILNCEERGLQSEPVDRLAQ